MGYEQAACAGKHGRSLGALWMRRPRSHGVPQPSISNAHAAARITETIEG
ncbi:MAG: hypothetical protein WC378_16860 [Opitutaceae bacterium]